ncbi:MAG: carbohydrate ABC transporter permease [Cellulosilyticaceae bacterium]
MKMDKKTLFIFLAPAVACFLIMFLYPIIVTTGMSFSEVGNISDTISSWKWVGLENYKMLFSSRMFLISLRNIAGIWSIGGVLSLVFAMLFAIILTSGVKFKGFWRAIIYLPNVVSAVALGTMWVQYVYSAKFGLLKSIGKLLGIEQMVNAQWTSPQNIFLCMVVAFSFGIVGYFMLIFIAGIERIPYTYYEAAMIEGAGLWRRFFSISLPLMKDVIKSVITLWTVIVVGFFIWTQVFTPFDLSEGTITPMIYMYQLVFGGSRGTTEINVGAGAAIGVILSIIIVVVFAIVNYLMKDSEIEF